MKIMTKDLFPILNQFSYMTINGYDVESTYQPHDSSESTEGAWIVKPDSDDLRSYIPNQEVELPDNGLVGEIEMKDIKGEIVKIECARHVGITLADIREIGTHSALGAPALAQKHQAGN